MKHYLSLALFSIVLLACEKEVSEEATNKAMIQGAWLKEYSVIKNYDQNQGVDTTIFYGTEALTWIFEGDEVIVRSGSTVLLYDPFQLRDDTFYIVEGPTFEIVRYVEELTTDTLILSWNFGTEESVDHFRRP